MLRYLSVKNFALIENCEIDFTNGLNIITGETGAGKSIIIQATAILLGARASIQHIRSGMEEAVLNATIDIADQKEVIEYLKSIGVIIEQDEIILRRILTASGKSRSFINGTQVTSKELSVISSCLFDFHGQHDGISLLKKSTHLQYLDDYLRLKNELIQLNNIYLELKKTEESLKFLEETKKDKEKRLELLNYEIEEIESSNVKDGEDEELKREIKIHENIEKITSSIEEVYSVFIGENGISAKLRLVKNQLSHLSEIDQSFNKISNDTSDIFYQLEDIISEISSKKNHYQYEPNKLDNLIERSEIIEKLKRKYGGSIEKINEYLSKAKTELELITFSSQKSEKLSQNLKEFKNKYLSLALSISTKRKQGSVTLENRVKEELLRLGMDNVNFKIKIEFVNIDNSNNNDYIEHDGKRIKYSSKGIDNVEFLISPNKGEPLKSLIKIASGGELSRIILALKSVLVENDIINTMIFDEIDAGIGGKVAIAVGKSIKKLAEYKQIICITHLPQIASAGKRNFLIQKNVVGERTIAMIELLDKDKKINEIARMLSGHITEVSLKHANELIISME
ncbi:MAG: DNA repair protein RecN [Spirochaetes bacterium]|nr:DNA repair protein RecN [Spirochaetota bacterium]